MTERYAGTLALARHALRRDRLLVGTWVALLLLVVLASAAAATPGLYSTERDRVDAARRDHRDAEREQDGKRGVRLHGRHAIHGGPKP